MGTDSRLAPIWEHWRSMDAAVATVVPTPWGAIVTDPTSPQIWDVNHARVDSTDPRLRLAEVAASARPALAAAGARRFHVVVLEPEGSIELVADLGGGPLRWESVMVATTSDARPDPDVIELDIDDARGAEAFRAQHAAFGVTDPAVVARLHELDRRLRLGADKRFFALPDPPGVARGPGGIAAFAALVPGTEVAYVDTVVTFPHARRRGLASRLVAHLLAVASPESPQAYLLVDADGPVRLYERLGFRVVTRIVSALEPA